jgi:hypothetical protein
MKNLSYSFVVFAARFISDYKSNVPHSPASVCNANTVCYFKCHLQSHLEFVKRSLKSDLFVATCFVNIYKGHTPGLGKLRTKKQRECRNMEVT